jgi:hypothetical protein
MESKDDLTVHLGALYEYRALSEVLAEDSRSARLIAGAEEIGYRLDDLSRHARILEAFVSSVEDERMSREEAIEDAVDAATEKLQDQIRELELQLSEAARRDVERDLHRAGIIEDPTLDGGLKG